MEVTLIHYHFQSDEKAYIVTWIIESMTGNYWAHCYGEKNIPIGHHFDPDNKSSREPTIEISKELLLKNLKTG